MEGSWTWNGDAVFVYLFELNYSDYVGSGIVHKVDAAALANCYFIRYRQGKYTSSGQVCVIPGANLTFSDIRYIHPKMDWFGFNAGFTLKLSWYCCC